jgi:serine/threonine protein kinase
VEKLPPLGSQRREEALPVIEPPAPESEIDGFVVRKLLHDDGRFRLYRADDREAGRPVLLRFPAPGNARAAQTLLASPYVLEPLALRTQRRTALYSVFEYRPFETLSHRIKRKQTLPLAEALELGAHLLAGLEALHGQGVVHGALRARALFFDRRARRLWLLGLGQAGAGTGDYGSDASYGAPEVLAGERVSERSDIYAAGVVIYHMLTGRYPYGRIRSGEDWKVSRTYRTLESQEVAAPPGLDEALERACARDPARRFASVAQFAAALDAVRVQQPAPTEPARRNERWGVWAAALLAAALAVYLYVTFG